MMVAEFVTRQQSGSPIDGETANQNHTRSNMPTNGHGQNMMNGNGVNGNGVSENGNGNGNGLTNGRNGHNRQQQQQQQQNNHHHLNNLSTSSSPTGFLHESHSNGSLIISGGPMSPNSQDGFPPGYDIAAHLKRKELFTQRKQREFIPDNKKDDSYWDRRRRNNEAAKRSREKRRYNDMVLEQRVVELTKENHVLKAQLDAIKDKYNICGENLVSVEQIMATLPTTEQVLSITKRAKFNNSGPSPGMYPQSPSPPHVQTSVSVIQQAMSIESSPPPQPLAQSSSSSSSLSSTSSSSSTKQQQQQQKQQQQQNRQHSTQHSFSTDSISDSIALQQQQQQQQQQHQQHQQQQQQVASSIDEDTTPVPYPIQPNVHNSLPIQPNVHNSLPVQPNMHNLLTRATSYHHHLHPAQNHSFHMNETANAVLRSASPIRSTIIESRADLYGGRNNFHMIDHPNVNGTINYGGSNGNVCIGRFTAQHISQQPGARVLGRHNDHHHPQMHYENNNGPSSHNNHGGQSNGSDNDILNTRHDEPIITDVLNLSRRRNSDTNNSNIKIGGHSAHLQNDRPVSPFEVFNSVERNGNGSGGASSTASGDDDASCCENQPMSDTNNSLPLKLRHKSHLGDKDAATALLALQHIKQEPNSRLSPPWDGEGSSDERDSGISIGTAEWGIQRKIILPSSVSIGAISGIGAAIGNLAANLSSVGVVGGLTMGSVLGVGVNNGGSNGSGNIKEENIHLKTQIARLESEVASIKNMMILNTTTASATAVQ